MRLFSRLRRAESAPPRFTGTCMVREFTADGNPVGACYFPTYDGVCYRHGDVSPYLTDHGEPSRPWPADYQLAKYDGQAWAERLRARQENHKRGNGF